MDRRITIWGERPLRAHETLVTEALALGPDESGRAARLLGEASIAASLAGQPDLALTTLARAQRLARVADRASQAMVAIETASVLQLANRAGRPLQRIRAAIRDLGRLDSEETCESLRQSGVALFWTEQYAAAEAIFTRVIDAAREERWAMLPLALDTLAALEFRTGRWDMADAHSAEAVRLARLDTGGPFILASALTTLARIAAARGREVECRGYLAEAAELAAPGGLAAAYAASAAGLLELGSDRPERAIAALEPLDAEPGHAFSPVIFQSAPDLIEAYLRSGRVREAGEALDRFETDPADSRSTWASAAAARCRGLLAPAPEFDRHFADALELHARTPTPFENARTRLCYGERLRRARRLTEAREQLTAACLVFDRLGAGTWADRARRELAPRRRTPSASSDPAPLLTAHEVQITTLVRRGATNREIAAALFVTDKTVEYHLGNVYRKLNVRSRTELVVRLEGIGPGSWISADSLQESENT